MSYYDYRYHPFYDNYSPVIYNHCGKITVEGVGEVKVVPDIGIITLAVVTEDESLKKAQKNNASISNHA